VRDPIHDDRRRSRFESLYLAHHGAVRRYAMRRTELAAVDDVVSETFLVAWRRLESVPAEQPLPWLFGVARRVLANQRRGQARRQRLADRLAAMPEPDPREDDAGTEPERVLAALDRLPAGDQELLMLVYWDGLDGAGAAQALGRSRVAVRVALSRARKRLRQVLEDAGADVGCTAEVSHAQTR
jgi:RNA polymerase sigma factor (sigma-70 family)